MPVADGSSALRPAWFYTGLRTTVKGVSLAMTKRSLLLTIILGASLAAAVAAQVDRDAAVEKELSHWRGEIDAVDGEIVALLNRRTQYVLKLAPLKEELGRDVRDAGREAVVLDNLKKASTGPLPDESLVKIYQAIMAAMRDLQSRD